MTNMSIQPLWLTHFIENLLVLQFQLTKFIVGAFSYKAHFRPQISSNEPLFTSYCRHYLGSIHINHSCCLIIHVHIIHFICYKWTFKASTLGHHHIPCHHMCHATSLNMPCHAMPSLFYDIIIRTPSYSMSSNVSCHILNYAMPCHAITILWHNH